MINIYVAQPNYWWRVSPSEALTLVHQDPDLEDGHQRWRDRDEQRWPLIAKGVIQVSEALAKGDWTVDGEYDSSYGVVQIDLEEELTRTELKILKSWFIISESVRMDPWFTPSGNGRHRLWATKDLFASSMVPVMGDALGYANPQDTKVLGPNWPTYFHEHANQLAEVDWFDAEDLQNVRFVQSLRSAANGKYPKPA